MKLEIWRKILFPNTEQYDLQPIFPACRHVTTFRLRGCTHNVHTTQHCRAVVKEWESLSHNLIPIEEETQAALRSGNTDEDGFSACHQANGKINR